MDLWPAILASAGVAAFVSSGMGLLGQHLERNARRKELLLQQAVQLADLQQRLVFDVAKDSQRPAAIWDAAVMAAEYYHGLEDLLKTGRLGANLVSRHKESLGGPSGAPSLRRPGAGPPKL